MVAQNNFLKVKIWPKIFQPKLWPWIKLGASIPLDGPPWKSEQMNTSSTLRPNQEFCSRLPMESYQSLLHTFNIFQSQRTLTSFSLTVCILKKNVIPLLVPFSFLLFIFSIKRRINGFKVSDCSLQSSVDGWLECMMVVQATHIQ